MNLLPLVALVALSAPDPGRFAPIATALSDYRALRDIKTLYLGPVGSGGLELDGLSLCALDTSDRLSCAGEFVPSAPPGTFHPPCFGPIGFFAQSDPVTLLDLERSPCAVTNSGGLFCAGVLTSPMLSPVAAAAEPSKTRPLLLTSSAVFYADQTIRTRSFDGTRFSAHRPIVGGPKSVTAMTQSQTSGLCLLGDDGSVHCTDTETQAERDEVAQDGPLHFERVGAPRAERGFGPRIRCEETPCREPLTGVVQLADAGSFDTCALTKDGEVACWESPREIPYRLPRFSQPKAIGASRSGVCAVTRTGRVECLGHESMDETIVEPLAEVPGLVDVRAVHVSREAFCAVTNKGRVDCRHLRTRPPPEPESPDLDADPPEPRYRNAPGEPAVAIIPWTRELTSLTFAGTWLELDEELSPLIGVTRDGRLLGARPPAGVEARHLAQAALSPSLPCLELAGTVHCRRQADRGDRFEPWREVARASPSLPWWSSLPSDPSGERPGFPELASLLEKAGGRALELVGWDGVPCLRFESGEVRCLRRGPLGADLVPVPAPRVDRHDICSAFIRGPGPEVLRGVIDLDGSHRTVCALTNRGELVCWGDLSELADNSGPTRRYAPIVVGQVPDAAEIAVTPDFVCVRTRGGEVFCLGTAGRGRAPGRWGGFGATPTRLPGVSGLTHLATLPGHPLACGFTRASARPDGRGDPRTSERPERKDPRDDPQGALAEALSDGQAICWGDDEALRFLNATFLGRPTRR